MVKRPIKIIKINSKDNNLIAISKEIAKIEQFFFNPPWSEKEILSSLQNDNYYFFTAFFNKEIVGYSSFNKILNEGYINNIAVKSDFQNQKVGFDILNEMILQAKKLSLSFLTLEVRKSNEKAIKLYSKLGFKIDGQRKDFYNNPTENGYIMTLKFNC
ncbi:MAG: ribosomal protein S18-alanine N-acetyltransferase [Clostridia bacterium]